MNKKPIVLNYGGGVNSTAILALAKIGRIPRPDYIVFSDTGAEHPHTYSYLNYIEKQGIKLTYLTGGIKGMTLIEYCKEKNFIPSRMNRWCTDYWKKQPLNKFIKAIQGRSWIGIDAGEAHRANKKHKAEFPLIDLGLNRQTCKEAIQKAGWGVPQKSGCFICPYQRKRQWIELKKHHPDLWKIAVNLEKNAIKKHENFSYKVGMTIEEFVSDQDRQEELPYGSTLNQKCECYFD